MKRKLFIHFVVILGYLLLTLLLTYPLILKIATHIPGGSFDALQNVWNLWWFKYAVVDLHSNPFYTNLIYHPTGVSLLFHTFNPFNAILSIPLQLILGLAASYNIIILFAFVAAGYGAYLLAKYITQNTAAAFIAGIIFTFSPSHFAHTAGGHLQVISIEWIPFYVLFFLKTIRESREINAFLAAFFFLLTLLCDFYCALYLACFSVLYLCYQFWTSKGQIASKEVMTRLVILAIAAAVLIAPIALPMLMELKYHISPSVETTLDGSADLLGFVTPSTLHPLLGPVAQNIAGKFTGNTAENTVFLGYTAVLIAMYSGLRVKEKDIRYWIFTALFFLVLSLGPVLHILGDTEFTAFKVRVPLPYLILYPLFSFTRVPARLIVMVMLSLSIVVAYGLKSLSQWIQNRSAGIALRLPALKPGKIGRGLPTQRLSRAVIMGLVFCAITFEYASFPLPLGKLAVPEMYRQIAAEEGDFALVELPRDYSYAQCQVSEYQYYQTIHRKKLVGGYVARNPSYALDFVYNTPVIRELNFPELPPDILRQDLSEVGLSLLNYYDVRYIILHRNYMTPEMFSKVDSFINDVLRTPLDDQDANRRRYRIIETGEPVAFLTLGNNWQGVEMWDGIPTRWMSNNATLFAIAPQPTEAEISFSAKSFQIETALEIFLNGKLLDSYQVDEAGKSISIPVNLLVGENVFTFSIPQGSTQPLDSGGRSVAFQEITLHVEGQEALMPVEIPVMPSVGEGANLIENPGFEVDDFGVPANWVKQGNPVYDKSGTNSYSGQAAVLVDEQNGYFFRLYVSGLTRYTLSHYAKGEVGGEKGRLQINWLDDSDNIVDVSIVVFTATTEYTRRSMTAVAPQEAVIAEVYVSTATAEDRIWYDDYELTVEVSP
ncbi:MAG: hypothetical protein FJ014_06670 [Chloroflexi bacterium]|nr:hypothetical protein [Chloroflexota bacterium]